MFPLRILKNDLLFCETTNGEPHKNGVLRTKIQFLFSFVIKMSQRTRSPRMDKIYQFLVTQLPKDQFLRSGEIYPLLIDQQTVKNQGVNPDRTASTDLKNLRDTSEYAANKQIVSHKSPHAPQAQIVWKTEKGSGRNGKQYYYKVQTVPDNQVPDNQVPDNQVLSTKVPLREDENGVEVKEPEPESKDQPIEAFWQQLVEPPQKRQKTTASYETLFAHVEQDQSPFESFVRGTRTAEQVYEMQDGEMVQVASDAVDLLKFATEQPLLLQAFIDGFFEAWQFK
jgi:hypothetical protein